jgi:PAS domain S-box-containing protein
MAEQGQTERAAWEGEMFRLLAENVRDYAIFVVNPHRHILSWSKGAERLLGFTEEEIIGRQCDCFFTPEDVERGVPQKELEQALASGRGEDDRWHMRKDGSRFWASGAVTPLKDEGGRLRGFAKIMRDRTEMRLAEQAAHERERQLQLLTDHAPVLIAHCDSDRRYKFVNKPFAARFGLHPREVVGKSLRDVLGDKAYAAIERHVDAALAGERVEFEVEGSYAGLGPQAMRCSYDPEFDAEGRVVGFVAALVNVTERRRAREALRESEERLRTLSDNLPHGAVYQVLGDREGHRQFLYISAGVERLFGVTPTEALADANSLYGLVHEEDRPCVAAAEAVALRDMAPFDCEFRSWTRSGELRWFHCRSAPRPVASGQTVWEGIILDVTARKTAEAELARLTAESERRRRLYETALSNTADFNYTFDLEGRFTYVNKALLDLWGKPLQEAVGKNFFELGYPPDVAEKLQRQIRQVIDTRQPLRDEMPYTSVTKGKRQYEYIFVPVLGSGGAVEAVAGSTRDITDRKALEVRLREQAERLTSLVDHTPLAVVEWDRDFRITRWSGEAERVFGWSAAEMVGKGIDAAGLVYDEDRGKVRETMGRLVDGKNRYVVSANRNWTKGGEVIHSEWYNSILADEAGRMEAVLSLVLDVTDRTRAEAELRQADRRKDEFLAMLAHELRNPLAPIRNAAQVIRLLATPAPDVRRATEMVERQVQHMTRLVDDLLDVSRITRGKITLQKEPVELAALVTRAVETARPLIEARRHELTVALPAEPVSLDADPTRLAQVIANLLTNAAKYTEEGGHVGLTARREGGMAVVRVRDDGVGIPREMLASVFTLFTQVDRTLARSEGGLGIGLTLVKSLTEMHGGTVEAHSEGPGKGSEFIVRLPVAPTPTSLDAGKPEAAAPLRSPPRRILVVDDNVDAAESLAMLLRLGRHEVRTAHDGPTALGVAGEFRPEVVLLDLGLPQMDGFEVARRLRGQAEMRATLLVALTGYGQEEDRRKSREAGFDWHMVKPLDRDALMKLLAGLKSQMA